MKSTLEAGALKDMCCSLNLTQVIEKPTRVSTSQTSSLIDVIMTSNNNLIAESGAVETHISDHFLVYSVLKLKLPKPEPTFITARTYKHYDCSLFVLDLAQIPWHENFLIDDVNEKLDHFNYNFLSVLERHAPIKTMKIGYRQCPFVDQEVKHLMNSRDKLHQLARQTRMLVDWERYRMCREKVKSKLREAEKEYM